MELFVGGILFLVVLAGIGGQIKEHYPGDAKTVEPEKPTKGLYLGSEEED